MRLGFVGGVPDDETAGVALNADRTGPVVRWPGRTSARPHLEPLGLEFDEVWLGPTPDGKLRTRLPAGRPLFNDLADADLYAVALAQLDILMRKTGAPVFNAPGAVLNSRRDRAAELLADAPGVDAPRVVRFAAERLADIPAKLEEADLAYPVIVRVAGEHAGKHMVRLDAPDDRGELERLPWYGRALYAIEFRDVRDPDGLYRKHRLVTVGGEVFLRHVIVGDSWLLHARSRAGGEDGLADEQRRLETFESELKPKVEPALRAIADALGLDYFGVDCHIGEDGRLTLFEANASMNVFFNSQPSPNMWDAPIRRILRALAERLRRPDAWRSARAAAAQG